jgi:hypothetical protein
VVRGTVYTATNLRRRARLWVGDYLSGTFAPELFVLFHKANLIASTALVLSPTVVLLDDKSHLPHLHVEDAGQVAPLLGQTWSSTMTLSARSFEDDGYWATDLIRQAARHYATATRTSSWATLANTTGISGAQLRWGRNSAGLSPGLYIDTITVTVPGAFGSPEMVLDSLRITSGAGGS